LTVTTPPPSTLSSYWESMPNVSGSYRLSVSFRNASSGIMCNGEVESAPLGYNLIVNQGRANVSIPLTDQAASNSNWMNGSCISKMGRHWAYDLVSAPKPTWKSGNLFPLMPMYTNGVLATFLIAFPNGELPIPLSPWEGPFTPTLFCENWCNSQCTWDNKLWSTLHFFVTNPDLNTCVAHC